MVAPLRAVQFTHALDQPAAITPIRRAIEVSRRLANHNDAFGNRIGRPKHREMSLRALRSESVR